MYKRQDQRKPILSPGYDFVATLPYIPNDKLALRFGGSRSLAEITQGQMRRFADTARIPASPLWPVSYTHLDVYKRQDSGFIC